MAGWIYGRKARDGTGSIPGGGWSVMKADTEGIVWGRKEKKEIGRIFVQCQGLHDCRDVLRSHVNLISSEKFTDLVM